MHGSIAVRGASRQGLLGGVDGGDTGGAHEVRLLAPVLTRLTSEDTREDGCNARPGGPVELGCGALWEA